LDLEQKAQSEQIESEHVNILSRDDEVRNNDLRELTQCFEQTSAEWNVKFEESHTWHAEVLKICPKNNEWCSQLEELTQRLETETMEQKLKFDQQSELDHTGAAPVNFETFRDQFESRLTSERKTFQEFIEAGVKSHASGLQDLSTMFNARIEDLTSCLDAGYDDREEKQKEQNQAEISRRTLETTLAEEINSQKKLIEAKSISCMRIAQSSDRESLERHMQRQDLESRVKVEIKTRADTIQKHKTQLEAVVCNVVRIGVPLVCFFFLKHMRVEQRTY